MILAKSGLALLAIGGNFSMMQRGVKPEINAVASPIILLKLAIAII